MFIEPALVKRLAPLGAAYIPLLKELDNLCVSGSIYITPLRGRDKEAFSKVFTQKTKKRRPQPSPWKSSASRLYTRTTMVFERRS